MDYQSLINILTLDYEKIIDAVRRLEQGISYLEDDDDKISARDLFERMRAALGGHMHFENQILAALQKRSSNKDELNFCLKMKEEHFYISGLLESIHHELDSAHSLPFKAVLTALKRALQTHQELEKLIPFDEMIDHLSAESLERMGLRADDRFL